MTGKQQRPCQYCDKPLLGYQARYRHEKRCPLNPDNREPQVTEGSGPMMVSDGANLEQDPDAGDISQEISGQSEAPFEGAVDIPDAAGLKAYVDGRFDELEDRLGSQLSAAIQNLEAQLLTLPEVIDRSVMNYLAAQVPQSPGMPFPGNGGHQVLQTDVAGPDQGPGQGSSRAGQPGLPSQINGPLGAIFQELDVGKMLEAWIKSRGDGDINTAVVRWLTGAGKKPAPPKVDTKYFSRGMGHAISQLRMKGVDPETQALSIKAQADQVLSEAGLLPDQRGYWDGMRAGAQSILDARALDRQIQSARLGQGGEQP